MDTRELIVTVSIECPKCGHKFDRKVRVIPPDLKQKDVHCLKCGYKWHYIGFLKSRIRCPRCGSSKNEVNRKTFGRFRAEK